ATQLAHVDPALLDQARRRVAHPAPALPDLRRGDGPDRGGLGRRGRDGSPRSVARGVVRVPGRGDSPGRTTAGPGRGGLSDRGVVIVGSGPNGLACAAALAREGVRVTVLEAEDTIGGRARSAELTLPGLMHDLCSAGHPVAVGSPFLRSLDLGRY